MPITISTSQNIGAVSGVTQSDESHATVADSIAFSGSSVLTLDKSLFCQRLLLSSTSNQLIAGTNNVNGSFATAKEVYINPVSPESNYFDIAPPLDLSGFFTLTNCDIVAGSNIALGGQTTFIGQYPAPAAALTGGANRIFKNVRIRSVNRNNIHVFLPHCTIDGLIFDRIDLIYLEANPVSAKNIVVSSSDWGLGQSDRGLVGISSSSFTRVFIQKNSVNGNELSLIDVAILDRYTFRCASAAPDLTMRYNLFSSFGLANSTPNAKFTLFDKNNNVLTTQTADSNGNTAAANIQYASFTAGSVGLSPTTSTNTPDNPNSYVSSSVVTTWQITTPANFTLLLLPLKVVHYGYNFLPSGQFINSIDTAQQANASGFRFSPKLATDGSVTLSESAALALTTLSPLNDLYDAIKAFSVTTANAWYPAPGVQIATGSKAAQLIDFGSRSLTIDPAATSVISVNTTTNVVTVRSTNLVKTTAFNTIKTSGTLTLKSSFDFFGDIGSTGVVVVQPNNINLITWTFELGATINVDSPTGTAIVTVAADQLSKITAGVRVTIQIPQASIRFFGIPNVANAIISIQDLTTSIITYPAIVAGEVTVNVNTARSYKIRAKAPGYQASKFSTIPGTTPEFQFSLTDYRALYLSGVNRSSQIGFNPTTFVVTITDATLALSFADVFRTIEDYLSSQQGLAYTAHPFPIVLPDKNLLWFPFDTTANAINPARIKPATTNLADPELLFQTYLEGALDTAYGLFDFTGAGGRIIRIRSEVAIAQVQGDGSFTISDRAKLEEIKTNTSGSDFVIL